MVQRYTLSEQMRKAMAEDEPAVKAALCAIANARFGHTAPYEGIFKYEGGIKVNGKEIAIYPGTVLEDWGRPRETIPEEQAVVDAIAKVAAIIEQEGTAGLRKRYGECHIGNRLVSLTGCRP